MGPEASDQANPPEQPGLEDEAPGGTSSADGLLVRRLRRGDADAGYHFFREYYPGVYRYLLYLTERPEQAEDLAQETFVRAWLYLDRFDRRGSLRAWLHRIAHREFLRSLPGETPTSLELIGEVAAPDATAFTGAAAVWQIVRRLPAEQREVVLLHDLEGYSSREIAVIVGAPASTVRRRLAHARERLRQELGEGDLPYLNEPSVPMRQWAWLPLDQMHALEARLAPRSPGELNGAGAVKEESMERREFLRQAAVSAAGLMLTEPEKEIVDSRLAQKVSCAFKATALSDLCEKLKAETGVHLTAGPSVADEKVTLFCEKLPLREVMRQLSRPFGYTWLRSGTAGQYRYELVQDLRSQLLEEELRNRDRNAALLAFEREMDRFRPYLDLSPDEALEKAKNAPAAEKKRLETLANVGWGPIQMYFRLSPQQMAALRSGQSLTFSAAPLRPDEYPLPPDMARGVLQCNRCWRVIELDDGRVDCKFVGEGETPDPKSVPLTAVSEMRAAMIIALSQSELGQFALGGSSGFITPPVENIRSGRLFQGFDPYVIGSSPSTGSSALGAADARLARDPALHPHVPVQPQPSCKLQTTGDPAEKAPEPKATMADVLEAIFQTTRMPIVADHYTRPVKLEAVSVSNQSLFEALNRVSEPMRLRWNKEASWLQFRSATYYNDRPKEVPNRLLARWAAARRQHGLLALDDLVEIAQLSDAQLDASEMAEGATDCWGLREWFLVRSGLLRPHLRFLAEFTPSQRQEMLSAAGLPFTKMSLAQQQGFILRALKGDDRPLQSLEELAGATLRVDYTQPGWYQWIRVGDLRAVRWAVAVDQGRQVLMPPVRERTPEAALRTARKLFPPVTEAMVQAWRRYSPEVAAEKLLPQPQQIAPTELDLVIVYIPSLSTTHAIRWVRPTQDLFGLN